LEVKSSVLDALNDKIMDFMKNDTLPCDKYQIELIMEENFNHHHVSEVIYYAKASLYLVV
jgi:hypothetical protein